MKLLKIVFCIILPPVAAYMQVKLTKHFWINIVLCLFVWVPGIIHALWLVLTEQK